MIKQAQKVLDALRMESGLYLASSSDEYHFVWIRDNCYAAMATLWEPSNRYEQTYHALFDIFRRYTWKLEYHVTHRPNEAFEYVHPRYTVDGWEVQEPWGNAQNDAIGIFLYGVAEGLRQKRAMFRDAVDRQIVQMLVKYLRNLEYWHDADNGMWEENCEVHMSSVGACAAGLLAISSFIQVDWDSIVRGLTTVLSHYPRESASKDCDLAELSLVYPYQLLPVDLARRLLVNVEQNLLRSHGTIRYQGDKYYTKQEWEAEWSMGLPWLGLAYLTIGDINKACEYLDWTERVMISPGVLPELFVGELHTPNGNTPLAWSQALYLILARSFADSAILEGMVCTASTIYTKWRTSNVSATSLHSCGKG